jgi:hypothetical protein
VERLVKRFEELVAWQKAIDLACEIDLFCRTAPFSRDFALVDQIRRAAHSVSSNIAEGFERCSRAEFRKSSRMPTVRPENSDRSSTLP